jgi:hypothetical protein
MGSWGRGTVGTVISGTGKGGTGTVATGSATTAVEEAVTFVGADSVPRGGTGGRGISAPGVAGAGVVAGDLTALRGRWDRTRERFRPGSGEACGSFCTEPETVSACR